MVRVRRLHREVAMAHSGVPIVCTLGPLPALEPTGLDGEQP